MSKQSDTIERFMGSAIFASRWMLAPFFRSLIIAMLVLVLVLLLLLLLLLLLNFGKELVSLLMGVVGLNDYDAIISVLTLIDTALIAVMLLIIVFSGDENFVWKLSIGGHKDRPILDGQGQCLRSQDQADQRHRGHLGGARARCLPRGHHVYRRTDRLEDCHPPELPVFRLVVCRL